MTPARRDGVTISSALVVSVVGVLIAGASYFGSRSDRVTWREQSAVFTTRFEYISRDIERLLLASKLRAQDEAQILHSPEHPHRDRLLEAYAAGVATDDQLREFAAILNEIKEDKDQNEGLRGHAAAVIRSIEQMLEDRTVARDAEE